MRVPEKIGQLFVLPSLTRRSIAILDEVNRRNMRHFFLYRWNGKTKWTFSVGSRLKRPRCEIRKHLYPYFAGTILPVPAANTQWARRLETDWPGTFFQTGA